MMLSTRTIWSCSKRTPEHHILAGSLVFVLVASQRLLPLLLPPSTEPLLSHRTRTSTMTTATPEYKTFTPYGTTRGPLGDGMTTTMSTWTTWTTSLSMKTKRT